jgi:hypothetical protein
MQQYTQHTFYYQKDQRSGTGWPSKYSMHRLGQQKHQKILGAEAACGNKQ